MFHATFNGIFAAAKRAHTASSEEFMKKMKDAFFNEIAIFSKLSHPGIPQFFGVILENDSPMWIVSGLISGIPLRQVMKYCRAQKIEFGCAQIAHIAQDILEILDYLHSQLVVHRDISANNIIISQNGHSKLIDFGLARYGHSKKDSNGLALTMDFTSHSSTRERSSSLPSSSSSSSSSSLFHTSGSIIALGADDSKENNSTSFDIKILGMILLEMMTNKSYKKNDENQGEILEDCAKAVAKYSELEEVLTGSLTASPRKSAKELLLILQSKGQFHHGLQQVGDLVLQMLGKFGNIISVYPNRKKAKSKSIRYCKFTIPRKHAIEHHLSISRPILHQI